MRGSPIKRPFVKSKRSLSGKPIFFLSFFSIAVTPTPSRARSFFLFRLRNSFLSISHQSPIWIKTDKNIKAFFYCQPLASAMPQKIFGSMPCPMCLISDFMALQPTLYGSQHGRNSNQACPLWLYLKGCGSFPIRLCGLVPTLAQVSLPQPSFIRTPSLG